RRDEAAHAEGPAHRHVELVVHLRGDGVAEELAAHRHRVVGRVDGLLHVALGLEEGLAHLTRHRAGDLGLPLGEQVAHLLQDLTALGGGHEPPRLERLPGRLDGVGDVLGRGGREAADHVGLPGGVAALERRAGARVAPLAADVVLEPRGLVGRGLDVGRRAGARLGHERGSSVGTKDREGRVLTYRRLRAPPPSASPSHRLFVCMETATASAERLAERLSHRIRSVPPSGIRRFFEIAATMEDIISLGIGEPDFVSPRPVIEAAKASLEAGKTGYTANLGLRELRDAIAEEMDRLYGVAYNPANEVIVTIGASEAMMIAMLALLDPGDEVLIPEPCFVSYGPTAQFCGGKVVWVPTRAENDFQVTASDIEPRITDRTKLLFLGYPNNPTGAVLRRDTLEEIAEVVVEHDLFVLSDEIYDRLV